MTPGPIVMAPARRPMAVPQGLLLYTDGLVERRDRPLAEGIAELRRVLGNGTADQMCVRATTLLHHRPATDDVALIAVRRVSPAAPGEGGSRRRG